MALWDERGVDFANMIEFSLDFWPPARGGRRWRRYGFTLVSLLLLLSSNLTAEELRLNGRVVDLRNNPLPMATVQLLQDGHALKLATSGADGRFQLQIESAGDFILRVVADGFRPVTQRVEIRASGNVPIEIRMGELLAHEEKITVTAGVRDVDILSPDPAERVYIAEDMLDANPGRPGAPVSIPGYPIETASSGIKAPQYFAPGVAGDHGEPIAQYIGVGSYLVPNNLSANAHGNGYADPNIFIPQVLESVQIDGGAFNVREGNHSVNLAATYRMRPHLDPFLMLTEDYRDIDVVTGVRPTRDSWIALEASYGNGFLARLEHRQQYKINGERSIEAGAHRFTVVGMGYYGQSYVPGLVPLFAPNAGDPDVVNFGDTIDPRQKEQTHSAMMAVNDEWKIRSSQELQLSGFFRSYNLSLYSDFGQGLIRQSEFRTVGGASANYVSKIAEYFTLLAGLDYNREAPRRDDLDHYGFFNSAAPGYYGPFTPVTANNVTIGSVSPYVAAEGTVARYFRYYAGWRHDEIDFSNQDLLVPQHSFQNWVGVNSPKAMLSFSPKDSWFVPLLSLSVGQAFFTNDPRIGTGASLETPVSTAHSYQLVASKTIRKTDVRLTLGHVTTSATPAKIDPDTGLQFDEGPGRLRFMTVTVKQTLGSGSLLATFSKADARDLLTGDPTPEAPRTIFDLLGTLEKLPLHLEARAEFEYVGTKPLGAGCLPVLSAQCIGTSVEEFRGALVRSFLKGRLDAGVNFLVAGGFSGQTTENFYPSAIQEVVGVRIPSYASVSLTYRFGHIHSY
jgi:carboxypeptidase family protein